MTIRLARSLLSVLDWILIGGKSVRYLFMRIETHKMNESESEREHPQKIQKNSGIVLENVYRYCDHR